MKHYICIKEGIWVNGFGEPMIGPANGDIVEVTGTRQSKRYPDRTLFTLKEFELPQAFWSKWFRPVDSNYGEGICEDIENELKEQPVNI